MFKMKQMVVAAALVLVAVSAMASNFRAADQVYIPNAGHITSSSTFISDIWIRNMSATDAVHVSAIYIPTAGTGGVFDQSPQYFDKVITLNPGESKEYVDFFASVLGQNTAFGALVFNACKKDADCVGTQNADGVSPNFRNILVFSRIYAIPRDSNLTQNPPTTGQAFAGIPWYSYASSLASGRGLGKLTIIGLRNTGTSGQAGTYRNNIGLMNASQYSTTTIQVKLYGGNGTQIGGTFSQTLKPLMHWQGSIASMFPGFAPGPTSTNAYVTVEQTNNQATGDAPAGCLPEGCPGFLAYGSVLDNATADATTLDANFELPLSDAALLEIYGGNSSGKPVTRRSIGRRP
jgi:hypothetical protein